MKKYLLGLLSLLVFSAANAQLQTWDLSASPGSQVSNTATTFGTNTTVQHPRFRFESIGYAHVSPLRLRRGER